jgi:hypothetical protein
MCAPMSLCRYLPRTGLPIAASPSAVGIALAANQPNCVSVPLPDGGQARI